MTLDEIKQLIVFSRSERVQELSVGDVHVLFAPGAMRVEPVVDLPQTEESAPVLNESEAEKILAGDDDLFRHVDGRPDVVEAQ